MIRHPALPLALAVGLLAAGCARKAEPPAPAPAPDTTAAAPAPTLAGGWTTDTLRAADAAGRLVTLTLAADSTARLVTTWIGKGTPPADSGRWRASGDTLTIQWYDPRGRAFGRPMTWRHDGAVLVPLAWDRAALGADGLAFHRP